MPHFDVLLSRKVVFFKTVRVEADDPDHAGRLADAQVEHEDTNDTLNWDAEPWETWTGPQVTVANEGESGASDVR
jgi:hypothetical protein